MLTQVLRAFDVKGITDAINVQLDVFFGSGYTAHVSLAFNEGNSEIFAVLEPVVFTKHKLVFATTRDEKQYFVNGIYGEGAARSHGWLLLDGAPLFYGTK